jgi:UDP-N-acetylmuramoyl-tripeptide--D-alanyl-D-alanine ligase
MNQLLEYLCPMSLQAIYDTYLKHPLVQTDTRKIQAGEIYIALKGPNFNGNLFARQALEKGAVLAVVDEDPGFDDPRLIRVADGLETLQELARHHRRQFRVPFLAITGSNGKTTTKELVHAVLSQKFRTYTTQGNLNNHIGIPLTILQIRPDAELAVIEMGANHQKEIEGYCRVAMPTHGAITNCGKAHLEGFGGEEGVRKGKGELYDYLRAHDGTAFVMWDYDYLRTMSEGIPHRVRYGTGDETYAGHTLESEPFLVVNMDKGIGPVTIRTRLVGDYNLPNVLVAVAVGKHFGVPDENIVTAIEAYTPSNSRSQMVQKGTNEIILDAYNANPNSMRLAIENLARQHHPKKIVMIGGMMELGENSIREHAEIVELLKKHAWQEVILVGGDFLKVPHPYRYFPNSAETMQWLREHPIEHAMVLVKGSRSMQMEKVMDGFPAPPVE